LTIGLGRSIVDDRFDFWERGNSAILSEKRKDQLTIFRVISLRIGFAFFS